MQIGDLKDKSKETFDAKGLTVLPGCIDTQVHFREPGSTDAEDLNSGSKAAVMGASPQSLKCQILTRLQQILKSLKKNSNRKRNVLQPCILFWCNS